MRGTPVTRKLAIAAMLGLALGVPAVAAAAPAMAPVKASAKQGEDKIHITADYMKYDRKARMALANGNVVIVQEDTTIRTTEVQFDQGQKVSYMNQPVQVVQDKPKEPLTTLNSDRMTTFHKEKRLVAEGHVRMLRAKDPLARPKGPSDKSKIEAAIKKEGTLITANQLEYWTQKKDATFRGDVVIINDQKKAWGDTAYMQDSKNTITLDGNVKVVQINGNWLVKEGIVKADKPDEARDEALRERATMTSDRLEIDQKTNDAVATGKVVRVEQKGKVATGRRAVFSDKHSTITMTENVRIQQPNGDWLTASKAVFHTDTEVFEAFSGGQTQVQTEFEVPDKQPKKDDGGRVEMEFDVNETER